MAPDVLPVFLTTIAETGTVLQRPLLGSVAIAALVCLGTVLRGRYTTQLGSPDTNTDAHDRCPRCATPNPPSRDHCEYCNAGLPETPASP